ncbi:MAG: diaminopimelate epimerase [Planctomycetaceae bacterium]
MRFTKMHGAGNDYIYIDCFDQSFPENATSLARQMSERRFSIGGDGVVLILPSDCADAEMRMFNADGTEAEMCGNALRCVAWFLRDRDRCGSDRMTIATGRGTLQAEILNQYERGGSVRVDMGHPILVPAEIPTTLTPCLDARIEIEGTRHSVSCVSMGNPHAVLFIPSVADAPVETLGPELETHSAFPRKANIGFAELINGGEINLRVWERGTGETLACGTGACAAVVAGILTNRCDRSVIVHLPGGDLNIEWPDNAGSIFKTGPVKEVFTGEWNQQPA